MATVSVLNNVYIYKHNYSTVNICHMWTLLLFRDLTVCFYLTGRISTKDISATAFYFHCYFCDKPIASWVYKMS